MILKYATTPPCNLTPKTALQWQFLGVSGSVYKGDALSISIICLLGLGLFSCIFDYRLFFPILQDFRKVYCVVSTVPSIWKGKGFKGPLVDASPLLASFCKTVRNSLLRLDLVCLGSVAKLLQPKPKSLAKGFPASICPTNCTSA